MQSNSLFVASRERHAGSLAISLGLLSALTQRFEKIAFFRPLVIHAEDPDCQFVRQFFQLDIPEEDMTGITINQATQLISQNQTHELYETLIAKYQSLIQQYDFVLVHGMDLTRHATQIDFDINTQLAQHFNAPLVCVLNGEEKTQSEIEKEIDMEVQSAHQAKVALLSIFSNKVSTELLTKFKSNQNPPCFYLPYQQDLDTPTMREITLALKGESLLKTDATVHRQVKRPLVAAMTVENYLTRLQDGDLVIVPGDRTEVLTASIMSLYARNLPNISGIILTGGLIPSKEVMSLLEGFKPEDLPIIKVDTDTYPTAMKAHDVRAFFAVENPAKTHRALALFDQQVDHSCLLEKLVDAKEAVTTPIMFEYSLFEKAKHSLKRILLPEAQDERILRATEVLLKRQVVHPVLLGNADEIYFNAQRLGLDLTGVEIIDPKQSNLKKQFIEELLRLRAHKGMTEELAKDTLSHVSYFATMMVHMGYADGMVSGATHTTADTIRPALQIIKTQSNTSLVSSVFFMCLKTRVLVFGDCAVNQKPNAEQLAEIALSSAQTAQQFGIDPKVALLSYSTGASGQGDEVEKVRCASKIAQQKLPGLALEGPLQYDAAIDAEVAKSKMPDSKVAGKASVFIFPDLNTGNNTYKAVQRASDAVAIGPILQGLNKPVNDLSRGCTLDDIVNTVAITAIQAQLDEHLRSSS